MKIIKYIRNTVLVALLLTMVSCEDDFLNPEPSTSISVDDVFQSYQTAQAAMVGAYDELSAYTFEGLYLPILSDIVGEDVMINSNNNWNWFTDVYQMEMLPGYNYTENPWWAGYAVLYDANKIIENANAIPDATDEQKKQMEGEARVLRAFVLLKLVQIYAPAYIADKDAPSILLVTKPLEHTDEDVPRAPLSKVYEQIESDLLAATELLDYNEEKGFFDKRAAQAVLARTYLNMQEWEKARDMAIAAHENIELMSISNLFDGFYYRNSETIFTVAYTLDDNNTYLSIPSFYYPVYGYSSMRANDLFVKKFSTKDSRSSYFIMEPEIDTERYLILKFLHNESVGNAERISIRASEMYLIEAECEAELGNYKEAQNALYAIQSRANPNAQKSLAVGQELIDEILLERRKELFGEGFRWNDIKRRQSQFLREGDHWVEFDFGPQDADYYRLTYPIPQSEIDANDMVSESDQNDGY